MAQQADSPVVVGVDGHPDGELALRWAVREAAQTSRNLELVHAYDGPGAESDAVLDAAVARAYEHDPDIQLTWRSLPGAPSEVLLDAAAKAALVVVGSRHGGRFSQFGFGSVSTAVATRATCPVLVVRANDHAVSDHDPVVVGTDGPGTALPALRFAFDMADRHGRPVRVVRAWQPDFLPDAEDWSTQQARHIRAIHGDLAALSADHPDVPVQVVLPPEPTIEALLAESERAHLLVVGTRGLGLPAGHLLGSVSLAMLSYAHCPVAVVAHPPRN